MPLDAISIVPTVEPATQKMCRWTGKSTRSSFHARDRCTYGLGNVAGHAIQLGQLGGMGVLNLEGLWTRYEDPQPVLDEIAALKSQTFSPENTARLQQLYAAPIQPDLISARLEEIREAGVVVAGALTPQRTQEFYKTVVDAGVDMFVIRAPLCQHSMCRKPKSRLT